MPTITEGLAEIKTIASRLAKKREFVMSLEKQGGSVNVLKEHMQSIRDLENRSVAIRSAVSRANASTKLSIGGEEKSVEQWLIWRREISRGQAADTEKVVEILGELDGRLSVVNATTAIEIE